jgi:hypothetical protein
VCNETLGITYLRIVVLLILLATAVGILVGVYLIVTNNKQEDFETPQFEAQASHVNKKVHDSVEHMLQAINVMSIAMPWGPTTKSFPKLPFRIFELRAGSSVCILSEALFIVWAPLIMKDN